MRLIAILMMTLLLSGHALARPSDKDVYEGDVEHFGAAAVGDNPRAMCLCVNSSETNHVGYMLISPGFSGTSKLACQIPAFSSGGELIGGFVCTDFLPMVR